VERGHSVVELRCACTLAGVFRHISQPQTFNAQHSTFNIQHSTFNIQHSIAKGARFARFFDVERALLKPSLVVGNILVRPFRALTLYGLWSQAVGLGCG
jgi:hypothetical protein